jgi:6-pyruvoyltetrahydropterin/6-carboxytetrahydropterin synthase
MHKLSRCVRFTINPFLPKDNVGFNSYTSKPSGEGLGIFFELAVELQGEVDADTGFVVNVLDIDKNVREFVVPIFAKRVRKRFRKGEHIGLPEIAELLGLARKRLSDKFNKAAVGKLSFSLNPFRKVMVDCEDCKMVYFSEKFEFAATHTLWNDKFSRRHNLEVFGKCANPTGHGHNYIVEVTVRMPVGEGRFRTGDFEKVVDDELIRLVDHKNLNADVAEFSKTNPTIENIAVFAWNRLSGRFRLAALHCITIWETDKTFCSYYGG